jgi:hypothetical protein
LPEKAAPDALARYLVRAAVLPHNIWYCQTYRTEFGRFSDKKFRTHLIYMIDKVDSILGKTLAHLGLGHASDIRRLMDRWKEIVGERIAAQATPLALKSSELVLAVPDAVWRQELSLMTPEIRDRINAELGRDVIVKIRLVSHGPVDTRTSPFRARHRRLPQPTAEPAELAKPMEPPVLSGNLQRAFAALDRARTRRLNHDQRKTEPPGRKYIPKAAAGFAATRISV